MLTIYLLTLSIVIIPATVKHISIVLYNKQTH